jgi:tRNA threonylcarbamoyladenosine modification (KEOPS) complex Cgi121 subunit
MIYVNVVVINRYCNEPCKGGGDTVLNHQCNQLQIRLEMLEAVIKAIQKAHNTMRNVAG